MKEELNLMIKEQTTLHEDVEATTDGFVHQLIALESRIDHLVRSRDPSPCKPEITEGFDNYLGTLWHDVNQLLGPVMTWIQKSASTIQR